MSRLPQPNKRKATEELAPPLRARTNLPPTVNFKRGSRARSAPPKPIPIPMKHTYIDLGAAHLAQSHAIASALELEGNTVNHLQTRHEALRKQLLEAKQAETDKRRELVNASASIEEMKRKWDYERQCLKKKVEEREAQFKGLEDELHATQIALETARISLTTLQSTLSSTSSFVSSLQSSNATLSFQMTSMETELKDARSFRIEADNDRRLLEEERRALFNEVMELKGNIRVFCRVRPILPSDAQRVDDTTPAPYTYPDSHHSLSVYGRNKQITLPTNAQTFHGGARAQSNTFAFDRVFGPNTSQEDVWRDVKDIVRSACDGYSCCVFAYGQTGSGKSYTMEGSENAEGMIKRSVDMVFDVIKGMEKMGWSGSVDGSFLEIYNETIHDLLTTRSVDHLKKHDIHHDTRSCTTSVTNLTCRSLHSSSSILSLLSQANSRRSVHATHSNSRSSRSHSVFILRISLSLPAMLSPTHEDKKIFGVLNLVDLAGSERLKESLSEGERLKETQAINKSLSALGDVICALGDKDAKEKHIPYRNSKLTYLLQNSLGGNSKTLMILSLSPLAVHANESINSLRFATKVNNTTIGVAKLNRGS